MSPRLRWPVVIVASSLILDLIAAAGVHGPGRVLIAVWFLLVCTGMSFAPLLAVPAGATTFVLGVAISVALDTLTTTTIVLIGGLSVASGLAALEAICLIGCTLQLRSWAREPRAGA